MSETGRWPAGAGDSEWAAALEELVAAPWVQAHRWLGEKGVVLDPQALIDALADDITNDVEWGRRRAQAARGPAWRWAGGHR